jgi:hypothetical protein
MKVKIKYFKLTVNGDKTFDFNHAGHCEQVLRGFVHSGHEVTIKEVTEIKEVTPEEYDEMCREDINVRIIDSPRDSKMDGNECGNQATPSAIRCR